MITPTKPIPEGNVTAKVTIMQNIQIVLHLNRKATDTTPPTAPVVTSDLTGKSTTTDPVGYRSEYESGVTRQRWQCYRFRYNR